MQALFETHMHEHSTTITNLNLYVSELSKYE